MTAVTSESESMPRVRGWQPTRILAAGWLSDVKFGLQLGVSGPEARACAVVHLNLKLGPADGPELFDQQNVDAVEKARIL